MGKTKGIFKTFDAAAQTLNGVTNVLNDFGLTSVKIYNKKNTVIVNDKEKMTIEEFKSKYKNSDGLDYFEAVQMLLSNGPDYSEVMQMQLSNNSEEV